jgi:hypothetical protein
MDATTEREQHRALAGVVGRRVEGASSSLTLFALALDAGAGLLAEARQVAEAPVVGIATPAASALPALAEAVCAVDWGWIVGSSIRRASLEGGQLRLELEPAGPLTVSAALWQGAPFLAFQPYRPAKTTGASEGPAEHPADSST